jgi:Nuclear transport factor 2 (NTF2) domain
MASTQRAELLAAATRSAELVGEHDRDGWIALFGADGRIEDPVGSRPHVGTTQIGGFYDTFIGPRDIEFVPNADYVNGTTVVRDLTLNVAMGSSVRLAIPAVLRYEIAGNAGDLRIAGLYAYWELPAMAARFARSGAAALPAGVGLVRTLLANQGVGGALGFARGFRGPGGRARELVRELTAALAAGDEVTTRRIVGRSMADADLAALTMALHGAHPSKILVAGTSVTVSLMAGRSEHRGVVIADVAGGPKIGRLRYYH